MSDPVFKANPEIQPLHLQAAAVDAQRLNQLHVEVPSTPVLHVDPMPHIPALDAMSAARPRSLPCRRRMLHWPREWLSWRRAWSPSG